jgi:hypothetical protein
MSCTFTCDNPACGKQAPGIVGAHTYIHPHNWFQRSDKDGIQDACSRACIEAIAARTGKTAVVLPL